MIGSAKIGFLLAVAIAMSSSSLFSSARFSSDRILMETSKLPSKPTAFPALPRFQGEHGLQVSPPFPASAVRLKIRRDLIARVRQKYSRPTPGVVLARSQGD